LSDTDVAIIRKHFAPVSTGSQLSIAGRVTRGSTNPAQTIRMHQIVSPVDQEVDALQGIAIGLQRSLGRGSRISEGARTEEVGGVHVLAGAATGASTSINRQGVIHEHRATQVGAFLQTLLRQAGVKLRGGGGRNNQILLHQGVVGGRVHEHTGQLFACITQLGNGVDQRIRGQSSARTARGVRGNQGAASSKQTLDHLDQDFLHVAHPVATGAASDGLHRIGTGKLSSKIAGLPALTTEVANTDLHAATNGLRGQTGGVVQDLRVAREITEERQVNGFAAFVEFGLDGTVGGHQTRSDENVAVLHFFLLITEEQFGDQRNTCEKHGSSLEGDDFGFVRLGRKCLRTRWSTATPCLFRRMRHRHFCGHGAPPLTHKY
jgi:hypothetical protein